MAARATRSASRKARATEAVATGPLGALCHDELGVIFDGLADPLQPVVAVALSSTCLGLRTPLQAALEVLKERHLRAQALCRKVSTRYIPMSCSKLCDAEELEWADKGLTADDMATLGMILRTNGLPGLNELSLSRSGASEGFTGFGSVGMQALCDGLGCGTALSLTHLDFAFNGIGPAGAEAFAAALRRGAMPNLVDLWMDGSEVEQQGIAVLAAPLRRLPALRTLSLECCWMVWSAVWQPRQGRVQGAGVHRPRRQRAD